MNKLRPFIIAGSLVALGGSTQATAQQIADVFDGTKDVQISEDNGKKNRDISLYSVDNQDTNIKNSDKNESEDKSTKNTTEKDKKKFNYDGYLKVLSWLYDNFTKNKFNYGGYLKVLSMLYDNYTLQGYSEKAGVNVYVEGNYKITDDICITLSESGWYTDEKNNPMSKNFVTDFVGSYNLKKSSISVGAEVSWYPSSYDDSSLNAFLMYNGPLNDKVSINTVLYDPLYNSKGEKIPGVYVLNTFEYNLSDRNKILFRTLVSSYDWKVENVVIYYAELLKNLSIELTFPLDNKSDVYGGIKYSF